MKLGQHELHFQCVDYILVNLAKSIGSNRLALFRHGCALVRSPSSSSALPLLYQAFAYFSLSLKAISKHSIDSLNLLIRSSANPLLCHVIAFLGFIERAFENDVKASSVFPCLSRTCLISPSYVIVRINSKCILKQCHSIIVSFRICHVLAISNQIRRSIILVKQYTIDFFPCLMFQNQAENKLNFIL
jgi:hypothetical protein